MLSADRPPTALSLSVTSRQSKRSLKDAERKRIPRHFRYLMADAYICYIFIAARHLAGSGAAPRGFRAIRLFRYYYHHISERKIVFTMAWRMR